MKLWEFGHGVTRFHTTPQIGEGQNLADHSWGVAMIVQRYFNGKQLDKLLLLGAALEHDLAEAIVGDMPKYARTQEHRDLEYKVAEEWHLAHVGLPIYLEEWLAWADLLEAGLYAQHQVKLGNQYFAQVVTNVREHITFRGEKCPPELKKFAQENNLCF